MVVWITRKNSYSTPSIVLDWPYIYHLGWTLSRAFEGMDFSMFGTSVHFLTVGHSVRAAFRSTDLHTVARGTLYVDVMIYRFFSDWNLERALT